MRSQQSLSGSWQFMVDPEGTANLDSLTFDREIPVPMPWQAVFPELQKYSGYAWYKRSFSVDAKWLDGEVLLQFGAVDYWCEVYVNGHLAGEHEGGYTPFTFEVGRYLQPGGNELVVKVYDSAQESLEVLRWPDYPNDNGVSKPPFNAIDIPHGKQEWYVNVGGIWQDVKLVSVPRRRIEHITLSTDIHTGTATLQIELAGIAEASGTIKTAITASGDALAAVEAIPGQDIYTAVVQVPDPRLWDMEDPYLYIASVTYIPADKGPFDEMSVRFGFREIKTDNGQIFLNGQPIYLLAALDQDMYADTIYTVPSEEFLRDEFSKAKALGLNCLRCHIKPPDPLYLDLADEMGLLVWTEIPSWRTFYVKGTLHKNQRDLQGTIEHRVEQTLREMLRRDCNHPSIIIWTLVNEDWGTSLPLSGSDRAWVSRLYDLCKELDPTRLVVDNSACPHEWGPNIHVASDIDDFHFYSNIPDQAKSWESTVEQFGLRPVWTYSSNGDARRTGKEPIILSEFGNWGLPSLAALRDAAGGKDPAWFDLGPWWSSWEGEPGWPSGVDERFKKLGLEAIWGSYEAFAEATQWHQYAAMKFEIEAMRRQQGIKGYVITELADIYWESNGLLDFYRNPKAYHALFSLINSPDVVLPHIHRRAYWDNEQLRATIHASHYGATSWQNARLRWSFGDNGGESRIADISRGNVKKLGKLSWQLPHVEQAQKIPLELSIQNGEQSGVASNSIELVVYPAAARQTSLETSIAVLSDDGPYAGTDIIEFEQPSKVPGASGGVNSGLASMGAAHGTLEPVSAGETASFTHTMQELGYNVAARLSDEVKLAVTDYPTAELLEWVRSGGDLLFISRGTSPFFWVQPRGGAYSGSWLTSYSWVNPGVHKKLYVENPLGLTFRDMMPQGTIVGLPMEDPAIHGDILSGMISGWVGNPAAHTVQFRYGKGKVIMTTFNLRRELGQDPVSTAMFHDLIDYLASDACHPTLNANY